MSTEVNPEVVLRGKDLDAVDLARKPDQAYTLLSNHATRHQFTEFALICHRPIYR